MTAALREELKQWLERLKREEQGLGQARPNKITSEMQMH